MVVTTDAGKWFQILVVTIWKARSPMVYSRVQGTNSYMVNADLKCWEPRHEHIEKLERRSLPLRVANGASGTGFALYSVLRRLVVTERRWPPTLLWWLIEKLQVAGLIYRRSYDDLTTKIVLWTLSDLFSHKWHYFTMLHIVNLRGQIMIILWQK